MASEQRKKLTTKSLYLLYLLTKKDAIEENIRIHASLLNLRVLEAKWSTTVLGFNDTKKKQRKTGTSIKQD